MKHMRPIALCAAVLVGFGLFRAIPASAYVTDPMIEGAKLCTRYLPRHEREHGIPLHLLAAIASTESGRYHKGLKLALPWPWTVNAEGKGYYFDTKQEAIDKVRSLQRKGVKSIDVGCMQVNLLHHPNAFANLHQAFEPRYNVAYAAEFLGTLFNTQKSWRKAAAAYHSQTSSKGNEYVKRVYASWQKIIHQVRSAKNRSYAQRIDSPAEVKEFAALTKKAATAGLKTEKSTFRAPRMKVIQVHNALSSPPNSSRQNNVNVVRPEPAALPAAKPAAPEAKAPAKEAEIASAQPISNPAPTVTETFVQQVTPKVISVDANGRAAESSRKSGPNFIFN